MLRSYFIIAIRHLSRHKLFASINIFCLAVGLTFSMLIGMYVLNEKEVNAGIRNIHSQYVLKSEWKQENMGAPMTTLGPLARTMKEEYPDLVENYYRFDPVVNIISVGEKHFRTQISVGDTTLVSMYGFPLLYGSPVQAFRNNLSAVVTEDFAQKFFGRSDVMDQVITVQTPADGGKHQFVITAVLKNLPVNTVTYFTTTPYQVFLPMDANRYFQGGDKGDDWSNVFMVGMLELKKGINPGDLKRPLERVLEKYQPPFVKDQLKVHLADIKDYYIKDNNNAIQKMIVALSSIAGLILLLAIINFININIGTSIRRLREMGLRKVFGGMKTQLIIQHMTEAVVLTLIASALSLVLYELLLPVFSRLLDTRLYHFWQFGFERLLFSMALVVGVGLLAGIYPAFVLSSLNVVKAVKGKMHTRRGGEMLRKILLVVQCTLAIIVFITAINVSRQVSYFFKKDLGYDKDQVMIISSLPRQYDSIGVINMENAKARLFDVPGVRDASLSYDIPDGNPGGNTTLYYNNNTLSVMMIAADADFRKVYGLQIKEGEFLPEHANSHAPGRIVLNETAVRTLGWTTAVGKTLMLGGPGGPVMTVAGVVKDFHVESLGKDVQPMILADLNEPFTRSYRYFSVKLTTPDISRTIGRIQEKFRSAFPDAGFEYSFMDKKFQSLYRSEIRLMKATDIATVLNFIIVFLGIFGILAFTLVRRTKEIAVRKVLGAEVKSIIGIFLKEYGVVMLISNLIAWPIAWLISNSWLENYAYRIQQDIFAYLAACISILFIAYTLITVQCFGIATSNPVNNLRAE
ncbi:MAG TPA: ABC transporter permease [Puia sp.]|nr:ABC transporter permease [Puia sp.]